jgi:cell division protein FtsL
MNAAARSINQSNFFHGQLADMRMTKPLCFQGILLASVLLSALAVVYTTNVHRMTLSQLETSQHKAHRLQLQLGQLLLEQASLATPSRVERLATDKLNMVLPSDKQTRVLRIQ